MQSVPAWVAVLEFSAEPPRASLQAGTGQQPGSVIAAMGSPFGALSLQHFGHHVAAGIISSTVPSQVGAVSESLACRSSHCVGGYVTCDPARSSASSHGMQDASTAALHLADMRCLPGMEGAPVLAADGTLVGVLAVPLSNSGFHAEV